LFDYGELGLRTSHARVLMCIAHDPGARLRDIAASLGITERSAYVILAGLAGLVRDQAERWPPATATRSRRTCRCRRLAAGTWIAHQIWRCQARRGDLAVRRTPHGTGEGCWSAVRANSG